VQRLRDLPLRRSLAPAWAPGFVKTSMSTTIVRVVTEDGVVGIGVGGSPKLLREVADRLIGHDLFETERLARTFRHSPGAWGIEIAIWDAIGKTCGQPVYKLWGAFSSRVRGYASMIEAPDPGECVDRVVGLVEEGFVGVKIRLHGETTREDILLAEAVRSAVGPSISLMADANQARVPFSPASEAGPVWDLRRARETARALGELDYLWLEEPLGRYDSDGLAALNASVDISIAGGEKNVFLHEFRNLMDRNC
jgi:L-alanine-DL-glutamate epimerase-like enolase superfamily enzyme